METGYLNFHDEEHFSDFSLSLGQHDLLDDSQSSLLPIEDDFDYVEARLDTSGGLWGTEQELNGDMAVLPVSGVASVIPKIDNMKEDFAKVLTDWQEHIGYLQASDMGEDIDMAELSMGITEKINTDLPEDIFQSEMAETRIIAHSSPMKKRQRDSTNTRSPKVKTISESSSRELDVIGLDSSEDIEPVLDLMHVECDHASSLSDDIDCELLAASRGKGNFDLASYITGDDDDGASELPTTTNAEKKDSHESPPDRENTSSNVGKLMDSATALSAEEANDDVDDSVDVETIVEQMPVLEAGDVKSLLEQFEASEASGIVRPIGRKSKVTRDDVEDDEKIASKSNETAASARSIDRSKQPTTVLGNKPAETQDSKFHKNIRDSLPKEVIDRIKASARKKVISVIPALSSPKVGARSTRMQEAAASLSRTKLLKIVTNSTNSSNGRVDGSVQLDHDYCSISETSESLMNSDVGMAEISSSSSSSSSPSLKHARDNETVNRAVKPAGYYVPITKKKCAEKQSRKNKTVMTERGWGGDSSSRKDSGLESGEVSDASEEQATTNSFALEEKKQAQREGEVGVRDKRSCSSSSLVQPTNSRSATTNEVKSRGEKAGDNGVAPIYEMKIRSALATSILQLRKGVLTKTKSLEAGGKVKQMISVLKKPPNAANIVANRPNESIVTTKNSSNDDIRNIIVRQESDDNTPSKLATSESAIREKTNEAIDDTRKAAPPRRKLNLAEYRSRREQTRSDNSRTCSPIQPMTLVYIHHASTSTEPNRDDPDNPVWSEREIVSVLKPKADFEDEKNRERPASREIAAQTGEPAASDPGGHRENNKLDDVDVTEPALTAVDEAVKEDAGNSETRLERTKERKNRRYRRRRTSSSSTSRSRSRSPTNRARSTSRSRNKSRSRSRRCSSRSSSSSNSSNSSSSNPRRRRISRRRSSVSSSSSWSSRSRSYTRSMSRSRSRSRSSRSRSRSRSRSSSRYSSCSRSSSRSNLGRSKWSGDARSKRRGARRGPRRSCDRYRRVSSGSSHDYRGWRRSSQSAYRRQYDAWYHKEKKRQMEERRVIYVGRLDENTAKADLRRRFEAFGPVLDISVHFREHGDNYGFVTFAYKNDAYEAVEHGNDDPSLPRYDLSFGGRRAFCKVKYADLDGIAGNSLNNSITPARSLIKSDEENTFDLLLKEAKAKLRKRKMKMNREMFEGKDYPTQWALNPSTYQNMSNDQVDWAALAQQWIKMKETVVPPAPPPPTLSASDLSNDGGGEAPMDVDSKDDDVPPAPPAPNISGSDAWNQWSQWGQWNTSGPGGGSWEWSGVPPPGVTMGPDGKPVGSPAMPAVPPAPNISNNPPFSVPPPAPSPYSYNSVGNAQPYNQVPGYWSSDQANLSPSHPPPFMKGLSRHPNRIPHVRGMEATMRNRDERDKTPEEDTCTIIDAAKRRQLPAWIREGLEKMEREKHKAVERERQEMLRKHELEARKQVEDEARAVLNPSKSKFDSDSEKETETEPEATNHGSEEVDRNVEHSPEIVVRARKSRFRDAASPDARSLNTDGGNTSTSPTPAASVPVKRSREEILQDVMLKVRRSLTEILLEVTNEEIGSVCREVWSRARAKAPAGDTPIATLNNMAPLAQITRKLGLGIYGDSNSESEDDTEEAEQPQDDDSDEELKETLRRRQQAFKKTEEEIEARLALEEENEYEDNHHQHHYGNRQQQHENHIGNDSCRSAVDEKETINNEREASSESRSSTGCASQLSSRRRGANREDAAAIGASSVSEASRSSDRETSSENDNVNKENDEDENDEDDDDEDEDDDDDDDEDDDDNGDVKGTKMNAENSTSSPSSSRSASSKRNRSSRSEKEMSESRKKYFEQSKSRGNKKSRSRSCARERDGKARSRSRRPSRVKNRSRSSSSYRSERKRGGSWRSRDHRGGRTRSRSPRPRSKSGSTCGRKWSSRSRSRGKRVRSSRSRTRERRRSRTRSNGRRSSSVRTRDRRKRSSDTRSRERRRCSSRSRSRERPSSRSRGARNASSARKSSRARVASRDRNNRRRNSRSMSRQSSRHRGGGDGKKSSSRRYRD